MPELRPFRGIRYAAPEELGDLSCPPYDIISPAEQEELHRRHPHNAVRIELAKSAGPQGYASVAETFRSWVDEGVLRRDEDEALYVYRQDFSGPDGDPRRVVGVIGALALEEFGSNSGVLPHERTMPGPIEDRLALLGALQVNVSPIYGIYRGGGALEPLLTSLEERPPDGSFADESGIHHRLWVITSPDEIDAVSRAVGAHTLVIADGHHRYETALTYHRMNRDVAGEHDAIMCFCVDADSEGLVVLPYDRAIELEGDVDVVASLKAAGAQPVPGPPEEALASSASDHPFVFVVPDGELLVEVSDAEVVAAVGDRAKAWRDLDVVALHEALLPKLFPGGVADFRFTRHPEVIVRSVREEGWDLGVLLRALTAAQVVDVARSGEKMPQKASYFWPKAATGLVFRPL
jgi:uncharacterized protein (DUF1015 family)